MRLARRAVLAVVFASVLLTGAVAPAVASADVAPRQGSSGPAQIGFQSDDGTTINATQEFALTPSTPGEVAVELEYTISSGVVSLHTELPDDAEMTDTDGFVRDGWREYRWDETTSTPSITYTIPVNESLNETGPNGADGDLVAVDAGDWALFQRPPVTTDWTRYSSAGPVTYDRTSTTAGPGAAGEWLVYLGEHETYERNASDQRFRLVVPANASMRDAPRSVLDSLADASDALRVGDRDDEVFVVAAPTDGVQWGVRGYQTGESDLWVRDVEPVDSAENPWVHEYVHTRQDFALDPEMRWFREASASYYAALLTYEQGRVPYDAFSQRIGAGANSSYADAVLANQSTWQSAPDYDKGALVAGQLDRQIRNTRDQERTLQTVVQAMNADMGPISLSDFLGALGEHGDDEIVDAATRYAEKPANVTMWDQPAHVMAFGDPPARIGFQLPGDGNDATYRVDGRYRNATIEATDGPVVVVPGERLRVGTVVENAGGRAGNFTGRLAVNGSVVDQANGSVAPNETAVLGLNHTFDEPGTYELAVGGDERTVEVSEPAEGRVTDVTATSREVMKGESVQMSARVQNDAPIPGETSVVFRRDDGLAVAETVRLAPESAGWVNASVPMSRTGATTVRVDGAGEVTVAVRAPPVQTTVDGNGTDGTTGPPTTVATVTQTQPATATPTDTPGSTGFGLGAEALAVTLTVALAATLAVLRERR